MSAYFYWRMQKMAYFYGKYYIQDEYYKLENRKGI